MTDPAPKKTKRDKLAETALSNLTQRRQSVPTASITAELIGSRHEKIPVNKIDRNPWQPRLRVIQVEVEDLAKSIAESSQIEPVIVRPKGERYELIAGERRWLAHRYLNRSHIEAIIRHVEDHQMAMLTLVENMQRMNLIDYEIGISIHRVVREFKFKKDLAEALGIGRTDFYRYLTFSELPEWVCSRLNESPSLISKRTAEGLKIFLQGKNAEHYRMTILAALDKLERGSLQQGEFVQYIAKAVQPKPDMIEKISSVFELDGRKIGMMQFTSNKSLILKLDGSVITGDKFKELEAFVKRLIG